MNKMCTKQCTHNGKINDDWCTAAKWTHEVEHKKIHRHNRQCRNETDKNLNNCRIQLTHIQYENNWNIEFLCLKNVASERFGQLYELRARQRQWWRRPSLRILPLCFMWCTRVSFILILLQIFFSSRYLLPVISCSCVAFWLVCEWHPPTTQYIRSANALTF